MNKFKIRTLISDDIPYITEWARRENFAPGVNDVSIYRNTDKQGLWVGTLADVPVGCIAGIKYNSKYGFIGLFIIDKQFRGNGYGLQLWKHAIANLKIVKCIGLEAAPDRVLDYSRWGFKISSTTTRWQIQNNNLSNLVFNKNINGDYYLLEGDEIPSGVIEAYDLLKERTPRPHFLSYWLSNNNGIILSLLNGNGKCMGFGRIRDCLLEDGKGWRLGPVIADSDKLAEILIMSFLIRFSGAIIIDSPGLNPSVDNLLNRLGFEIKSKTIRMYRGHQPQIALNDIYGLASLELG